MAFSRDGSQLAIATLQQITIFETNRFEEIATLEGGQYAITQMAFWENSDTLMTGGSDGKIRFWDLEEKQQRLSFPAHQIVLILQLNEDRSELTTGGPQSLRAWPLKTKTINTLEFISE